MTLGLLLPAAGTSSRMGGRDKLLEEIDGTPLLLRQVRAASETGLPLLVTLPPVQGTRAALLAGAASPQLEMRRVPDAANGISASLRVAAHWASEQRLSGLMIVLPDMPDLTARDLQKVTVLHSAHPSDVIRATDDTGRPGHPTVLPARLMPMLVTLTGDSGARDLLKNETIRTCPLAGTRATTDLDTPEAWAAWRAARD